MKTESLATIAAKVLLLHPQPVPRFRLLRDVLFLKPDDPELISAKSAALQSQWVKELEGVQESNGIWGRFHSQDTKVKKTFRTSEAAIQRALSLGLDKDDAILKRAVSYIEKFLLGQEQWSDWAEKHEGWVVNTRFITAGTLAKVDPLHPLLPPYHAVWVEILKRTFASGTYDAAAERAAHRQLNAIFTPGKYLHLGMLYPLLILTSGSRPLPEGLEDSLLKWLWQRAEGTYYVTPHRLSDFPAISLPRFCGWLTALEVLSRFPHWKNVAGDAIDWIWSQRAADGLWDMGSSARTDISFPLSDSWRDAKDRKIDCTVRVLAVLAKVER